MRTPIIFCDFFGVVISEIAPVWLERYFPPEEAAVIKADIFNRADCGLISEEQAYLELSEKTGVPPAQIRAEWDALVKINSGLADFLRLVKQRYPVYLLSNAMSPHIRRILDENDLYSAFDRVFISSEMRRIKPDPALLTEVLETLHADPTKTVMIDDNPKNIQGAKQAGLSGIIYRNNQQLFSEVSQFLHRQR